MLRRQFIRAQRPFVSGVWPIDEMAGRSPVGWSGWPGGKRFALVLSHDVDTEKGLRKCLPLAVLEQRLGFRSTFNFLSEAYQIPPETRKYLTGNGFDIGMHGLVHDEKLFTSRRVFQKGAVRINRYLQEWESVGFHSPSMHHNLEWMHDLNIEHDTSTFDTDPFEPQPDGVRTIFPFWVQDGSKRKGFVELPYTLPQDFTLFIIMKERNIDIWKRKLDWIAEKGGMALLITHPDYMNCENGTCEMEEYPIEFYVELLDYVKRKYEDQYWHALPKEMARFWKEKMVIPQLSKSGESAKRGLWCP